MVNIRTRVAMVNIAFSSSRNAALTERKKSEYTTLSIKIHHCTLKKPSFYIIRRPYLSLNTLRGSETTLKPVLINKNLLLLRCKHVLT